MNVAISVEKEAKKNWQTPGRQDDRVNYMHADQETKEEVARSRTHAVDEVYNEVLNTGGRTKDL